MKFSLAGVALLLVVVVLALALGGCSSPEAAAAHDAFTTAYTAATADGNIDPNEAANLHGLFKRWIALEKDGGAFDWQNALAHVGTIAAAIMGTNAYRNRNLPGAVRVEKGTA